MDINEVVAKIEKVYPDEASALSEFQTTFNGTLEKVAGLEKDLKTAAEKRDQLKTTIREATGLDEITIDGLKGALGANGDEKVEVYKKEVDQLKTKLGESANAVDEVAKRYEAKIFNLQMDRAANMLGAQDEVHGVHAYQTVLKELSDGAQFNDDGTIVYKNPDGTTVYGSDGKELTFTGKYEQLKADDSFAYLFKEQFKTGGGKGGTKGPTNDAGGAALRRSKLSENDKVAYIAKYGINTYMQLPY